MSEKPIDEERLEEIFREGRKAENRRLKKRLATADELGEHYRDEAEVLAKKVTWLECENERLERLKQAFLRRIDTAETRIVDWEAEVDASHAITRDQADEIGVLHGRLDMVRKGKKEMEAQYDALHAVMREQCADIEHLEKRLERFQPENARGGWAEAWRLNDELLRLNAGVKSAYGVIGEQKGRLPEARRPKVVGHDDFAREFCHFSPHNRQKKAWERGRKPEEPVEKGHVQIPVIGPYIRRPGRRWGFWRRGEWYPLNAAPGVPGFVRYGPILFEDGSGGEEEAQSGD